MATEIPEASPGTVYDQIADIVGIARGGRRRYAGRSEEVLRALFARKRWRRWGDGWSMPHLPARSRRSP